MKKNILLVLLLVLLTACGGGDDNDSDETSQNATAIPTPNFLLVVDSLPPAFGGWTVVEGTLTLEEGTDSIVLSADYTSPDTPAVAQLDLTLYRDAGQAQQDFSDRVAALQSDSSVELTHLTTLADDAYLINTNQGGLALVDINGVLVLAMAGDTMPHDEYDVLNLMQIGVNALRARTVNSGGGLGSATLAPIVTATP